MPAATEVIFDRDRLADWYAHRHFQTDAGVEAIHYLPANAPEREIRLLEVNRLIAETTPPEPIDFGVDTGNANGHTLFVLDLTPAQWLAVQHGNLPLPAGWSLDGKRTFQRN
ncbi:MAG: hypothetical protein U0793_04300 [Gemmataceae bacterium]